MSNMLNPVFTDFFMNQATHSLLERAKSIFKSVEKDWESAWLDVFVEIAKKDGYLCPTLAALRMMKYHKHGVSIVQSNGRVWVKGSIANTAVTDQMSTDEIVSIMTDYFVLPDEESVGYNVKS